MDFENLCNISVFYLSTISPTLHTALGCVVFWDTCADLCWQPGDALGNITLPCTFTSFSTAQAHLADVNNKNNCVDRYIYIFMIVVT